MCKLNNSRGFTLIELMLALAIIAILTAIAYPSYTRYIDRANRADATDIIMQMAVQQERSYSRNATFLDTAGLGYGAAAWAITGSGNYEFRVNPPDAGCLLANCYVLEARPIGGQVRDLWEFRLSSSGQKQSRRGAAEAWVPGWPTNE